MATTKRRPEVSSEASQFTREQSPSTPAKAQPARRARMAGWRVGVLAMAGILFCFCTIVASRQKPRPVGMVRGPAWTLSFWTDPLEWNSIKRLARVDADLTCVFAGKDGTQVH